MNLWLPHDAASRAEAAITSVVANQFISTKTSSPVNGQVQDAVVGCAKLTRSDVRMDKFHAMSMFQEIGMDPPYFGGDATSTYTGRDIVSMLFQTTPINYSRAPTFFSDVYAPFIKYDKDELRTVMERGVLRSGVLDKAAIGAKSSGGIYHLVSREYGSQRALDLIFALQQIALQFLMYKGFTVGTSDLAVTEQASAEITKIISGTLAEAQLITDRLTRGEIIPPIGMTTHEFYEKLQISALRANDKELLRWILGSIRPDTNGMFQMVAFGAKGNNANLIHIMGLIQQVLINGERIREQFAFRRTLPYFPRFATDPFAFGFIANSYMSGMTSPEFICSDMNGRFDLINKALSTSITGYFMRKGIMSNQSTIIDNYRRCVKDTKVVQTLYGEDGLDARQVEKVTFRTIPLSNAALRTLVHVDVSAAVEKGELKAAASLKGAKEAQATIDQAFEKVKEDRDMYRKIFGRVERSNFRRPMGYEILMPVNVERTVQGVFIAADIRARETGADTREQSTPEALAAKIERVWDLCARFPYLLINEIQEKRRSRIPKHLQAATTLMTILIRAELTPRILTRVSDAELTFIIDSIRARYSLSLVEYGRAAGILACQAVSEPLTQYMLDSHHRSVSGGTNKSGLVRVSEIYGARPVEDEQSPAMLLPVKAEYEKDLARVQEIANSIEHMAVRRFVSQYDVLYEPYDGFRFPPYLSDTAWAKEFERNHPLLQPPADLTNWCFRLIFDKSVMVLKSISFETIVERMRAKHPNLFIVHTPESVPAVLMRIFVRSTQFKRGAEDPDRVADLLETILDTPVRGIRGIMTATAEKITRTVEGPDGALVKSDVYAIATVGTNLYGVMMSRFLRHDQVISNSVGDTLKMFGIEAARNKITSETRAFMEGSTPNLRHIMLYSDEMTRMGRVTSVERGGIGAREPDNILLRMAASAPIQILTEAALNATRGRVYGIAAPLMLGTMPKIGTFYNDLIVDEQFVSKNTVSVDSVLDAV